MDNNDLDEVVTCAARAFTCSQSRLKGVRLTKDSMLIELAVDGQWDKALAEMAALCNWHRRHGTLNPRRGCDRRKCASWSRESKRRYRENDKHKDKANRQKGLGFRV